MRWIGRRVKLVARVVEFVMRRDVNRQRCPNANRTSTSGGGTN
jgi:hypothetical protein